MDKDMTTGTDWKLILSFTLPIMAGNLLQQLYNTVDGIVVGNFVGENAFAATGTCTPLTLLFLAFAIGLGMGGGIIISQFFGAKKTKELQIASSTILILLACIGLLMTILGFSLAYPLLKYVLKVSAENDILSMSIQYFRIYSLGLFFQFIYNAIAFMLRSIGDSKATLYFLAISAVMNIILDLLFVAIFHWGVAGAAIATVISQICCAVVSYIYMIKRAPMLKPDKSKTLFDRSICLLALKMGLPSAIQQCVISFGNIAMQRLVNSFGSSSMSGYSASGMIEQFAFIPIFGFNSGMATFSGQNVGAKQIQRAKDGMKKTQAMALFCCIIISSTLYILAPKIISLFGLYDTALTRGVEQIRFVAPFYLIFSVNLVIGGLLQGSGDVFVPMVSTISSLFTRVLLGYLSVYFGILSYNAAWVVIPIAWLVGLIINLVRYLSGAWVNKVITDDEQIQE